MTSHHVIYLRYSTCGYITSHETNTLGIELETEVNERHHREVHERVRRPSYDLVGICTIPKTHCGEVAGRPLPYCRCWRFMILIVAEHTKGNFTLILFMTKERLIYVNYLI